MIDQATKDQLVKEFRDLTAPVKLVVFTQKNECRHCEDTRLLAEEVTALSPSLSLEVRDFVADKQAAEALGIDKIPAIAVLGREDYGIRFFGIPAGYEFTSLVEAVKIAGTDTPPVGEESLAALGKLAAAVSIQVFVTPA